MISRQRATLIPPKRRWQSGHSTIRWSTICVGTDRRRARLYWASRFLRGFFSPVSGFFFSAFTNGGGGRFHLFQCCDLDLCSSQRLLCRSQLLLGPPQLFLRLDQFGHHLIQFFRQPCDLLVSCHLCQFIRKVKSEPLPVTVVELLFAAIVVVSLVLSVLFLREVKE